MSAAVAYASPFLPPEWIAAHGFRPMRLVPQSAGAGTPAGVCPHAHALAAEAAERTEAALIVLATDCDQTRRIAERTAAAAAGAVFLFNVPATWQSAAAHRLYAEELRRLGRALCDLGAVPPANAALAETMALYEAARQRLLAGRPSLGSRQFFEALLRYHRDGALESSPSGGPALPLNRRGIALAIVGAPLHPDWAALFDAIELAGGRIELDATALGERALPPPFDRRRLREEPFETLCDAYFGKIPDAFRRPNSQLYRWLRDRLAERGVRGILFHEYTWCDTWRAEFARMKEWASAPIHRLENQGQPRPDPRLLFRLEAFLEMLAASALRRPSL